MSADQPANREKQLFEQMLELGSVEERRAFLKSAFDLSTQRKLAQFRGHTGEFEASSFSPDGKRVLSCAADGTAKLWDAETGRELLSFKGTIGAFSHPTFSPDGRRVLMTADGNAVVLEAMNWHP